MCWLKGKGSIFMLFVAITLSTCPTWIEAKTVFELLQGESDIREFAKIADSSPYFKALADFGAVTVFAPTNDAIQAYQPSQGKFDNYTLRYHLSNLPLKGAELGNSISTDLPGNPPIWVTRQGNDIYLNDAKIIGRPVVGKTGSGEDQVLYKIDRVLEPTMPTRSTAGLFNPDASVFLEQHSQYVITGTNQLGEFAQLVKQRGEEDTLRNPGNHTFFIPIDEALKKPSVKQAVSQKVIEGHVIPNQVIFLRSSEPAKELQTVAFGTDLKVLISIEGRTTDGQQKWTVTSDTRVPDAQHRKGLVNSDIIKGNIPVKNGVVHIIRKPLVVIDQTVYQTLETFSDEKSEQQNQTSKKDGDDDDDDDVEDAVDSENNSDEYWGDWFTTSSIKPSSAPAEGSGALTKEFFDLVKDRAQDVLALIREGNDRGITVFVPTNEAIATARSTLQNMNDTALRELLRLHIVKDLITSDAISQRHGNESETYQVETMARGKKLFFNMVDDGNDRKFYVEGGVVNATIEKADIAATDGVIHLINKVLGFADISVYDKIRTDPMLKTTFELTNQDHFNELFKRQDVQFTIFAPSNDAWRNLYFRDPNAHTRIMSGNNGYHVGVIMRRHVITGSRLTIEELHGITASGGTIRPIADILEVKHKNETGGYKYQLKPYKNQRPTENFEYAVFWNLQHARVIRPNINCTNGIIHIIDNVLMVPEDLTASSAGNVINSLRAMFIPLMLSLSVIFGSLTH